MVWISIGYRQNRSKTSWELSWKGMRAMTRLLDAPYEKGIKVCGDEKSDLEKRLDRSAALPWWDIKILPKTVTL
jgi:hypothetical protein